MGLSRPAVSERLGRLERDQVISGYRVDLNPTALGLLYTVFVRVRPAPGQAGAIERVIREIPSIVECYRTTGDDCFLFKAHLATIPEFEGLIARLNRYGQTSASDVLSAVVAPRAPSIPSAGRP